MAEGEGGGDAGGVRVAAAGGCGAVGLESLMGGFVAGDGGRKGCCVVVY